MSMSQDFLFLEPPKISDNSEQKVSYSDVAAIRATAEEIIFHFGLRQEDNPSSGKGVAKIYVSPAHAKRIANALVSSIKRYEEMFGAIEADFEKRLAPEILEQLKKAKTKQQKGK